MLQAVGGDTNCGFGTPTNLSNAIGEDTNFGSRLYHFTVVGVPTNDRNLFKCSW
ncbi:MAG: hypothetical protein GXO86_04775 [Chlorobi bacterium]|nr:hypothetical protein [Chlorobiota bacterium]